MGGRGSTYPISGRPVCHARPGFSLIELLATIAIISLLISIVLPAMSRARERARTAVCLSHLRSITTSTEFYLQDEPTGLLAWYTYPKHCNCPDPSRYTPWVFGGFAAPAPKSEDLFTDSSLYPAEIRPLNWYVDPAASGFSVQIDLYKCPSDASSYAPLASGETEPPPPPPSGDGAADSRPSWLANGNSYSLNTRFMQGYAQPSGEFKLVDVEKYARRISPHLIGGKASRFVIWSEQGYYSKTYKAAATLGQSLAAPQGFGWHNEFSKWSLAFADGHVEYRSVDTRLSVGSDWTIWEPK